MVELPSITWLALTRTTPRSSFFLSVDSLSPYHSGYPMSAKQEFALCPLRLQLEQIIVLSFPCCSEDCDLLRRPSFFPLVRGLTLHHSGYPMSAKQEFTSCPLPLQWEQKIILSFPSTLPQTTKAITFPLSLSHVPWFVLVLLELESSKLCSDSAMDRVPKY